MSQGERELANHYRNRLAEIALDNYRARNAVAYPWQKVFNKRHYRECTAFFQQLTEIGELTNENLRLFTNNYGLFNYYRLVVAPPGEDRPDWALTRELFDGIYYAA